MDNLLQYLAHYVEYAPGVVIMGLVVWRMDRYAAQIVRSCINCWDRDAERAHDVRESMADPE